MATVTMPAGNRPPLKSRGVLVLGSTGYGEGVSSYAWGEIPANTNVIDFEKVILDFSSHPNDKDMWPKVSAFFSRPHQWAQLVFSQGAVVIGIGVPFSDPRASKFFECLPAFPVCQVEKGETFGVDKERWSFYFEKMKSWEFYATGGWQEYRRADAAYLQAIGEGLTLLTFKINPIASSRSGKPIAFGVEYVATGNGVDARGGVVVWVPPPTEVSTHVAVERILSQLWDIGRQTPVPEWLRDFRLPVQAPIAAEIQAVEGEVARLRGQLKDAEERLAREGEFLKLLFAQGSTELEPIVRAALVELGGAVSESPVRGKDDGRVKAPDGGLYILEIKGLGGSAGREDVRQLRDWHTEAEDKEDFAGKGLLIVNAFCKDRPGSRQKPFPPNVVSYADRYGYCLMTTSQLFQALVDKQNGLLELADFWERVGKESGVSGLPDIAPD